MWIEILDAKEEDKDRLDIFPFRCVFVRDSGGIDRHNLNRMKNIVSRVKRLWKISFFKRIRHPLNSSGYNCPVVAAGTTTVSPLFRPTKGLQFS